VKEHSKNKQTLLEREQRLIAQLRRHPQLMERLEVIVEMTHADGEKLPTADQVEERLVEEVRRLGHQVMEDWAGNAEARVGQELEQREPGAGIRKKKP